KDSSIASYFSQEQDRATSRIISTCGLTLDYSKSRADAKTFELLKNLAIEFKLEGKVAALFAGEAVNNTEERSALHTLLRSRPGEHHPDLADKFREVEASLIKIERLSQDVRSGAWLGSSGKAISDILHIGIGGSYLGPRMIDEALTPYRDGAINCHYVANVDGHHIDTVLQGLDRETTLIIVASKSFSTMETRVNAVSAQQWLLEKVSQSDLGKHLVAITDNVASAVKFGVNRENIIPMWDWVGGRYSLWSAVGLPIAIRYGYHTFRSLLDGAADMDQHFSKAEIKNNMPIMLALIGVWYHNFLNINSHAVLPYDHWLRLLPAHLQQLDMESNGKSVTQDGTAVDYTTGPLIWGGEGTNGQHAFHQLLHQGTAIASVDFILPLRPHHHRTEHHDWLVASCLSQSQALMQGRSESEIGNTDSKLITKHKVMPGNRPSNTLLLDQLTPQTLGALVALYEHKIFCQGMIWDINPFDQWGVELGKVLGENIYRKIEGAEDVSAVDPSTNNLTEIYKSIRNGSN
ncbi:MAG: glucose-6-phosphate isomerase, partial [Candidatus Azotimanducaceae bacterium]